MKPQTTPTVASLLAGMLSRAQLATQLGRTERTVIRWEHAGLPVIKFGHARIYDPKIVREWLMTHERRHDVPRRGRPAKRVAA